MSYTRRADPETTVFACGCLVVYAAIVVAIMVAVGVVVAHFVGKLW